MTRHPHAAESALEVQGLSKKFGSTTVLDQVDLSLAPCSLTVLTGANGAGKSTLLECLAGAQPPDHGRLLLHGNPAIPQERTYWQSVYAILDDFAWFPDLTVGDHFRLLNPLSRREDLLEHLRALHAESLVDRKVMTLSSGQRQRCALVSALVRPWTILLIDEPERHLDRMAVETLCHVLRRLSAPGAVLVASHDARLTSLPGARRLHLEGARLVALS